MTRVARFDRGLAHLDFAPDAVLGPGVAPATETPEGYVRARAFLARDGLLEYGDGRNTWLEYRPRVELERSMHEWADKPLTVVHPDDMVSAETWDEVSVGHITCAWIEEVAGVAYLAADILIMDAEAVRTLRSGEKREVSIGFWCQAIATEDGRAVDGTECAYVQTSIAPNHAAFVDRGRAGSACRVFLDAANAVVHDSSVAKRATSTRADMGAPTETVEYPLPDGTMFEIPTAVASLIETLQQQVATLTMAATKPAAPAETPEAAEPPEPAEPPTPEAAEPPESEDETMPPEGEDPEEDEKMKQPPKKTDAVTVPLDVVRAKVRDAMPEGMRAAVDSMTAEQLAPLFAAALSQPAVEKPPEGAAPRGDAGQPPANPFAQPAPVAADQARNDAVYMPAYRYLMSLGH